MASIGIAYSSQTGTTFNVTFSEFSGAEFARTYDSSVEFQRTSTGVASLSGLGAKQKRIWALNGHLTEAKAKELDDMFVSWDRDRSNGHPAACGLTDETLFDSYTTSVVISTPPSFAYVAPNRYSVAIGVVEV